MRYEAHRALDPFFAIADDAVFESPGYGNNIVLDSADELVVHRADHVVTLEYDVHGMIVATGGA